MLRHSLADQEPKREQPIVSYGTGPQGEQLQAQKGELAVQFHRKGNVPAAEMSFCSTVLAEFEGKSDDPVTLEMLNPGLGKAAWRETGVPRTIEFDIIDKEKLPV